MPRQHRRTHTFNGETLDRTFRTKKLADEWKSEMVRKSERVKAGLAVTMDDAPMNKCAAKWILLRSKTNDYWAQDEAKMREMLFTHDKAGEITEEPSWFAEKSIRSCTKADCEMILHEVRIRKGLKGASFNRYRTCLHTFFEYAIEEGYRETNPVTKIDKMPEVLRGAHVPNELVREYIVRARTERAKWFFPFVVFAMNAGPRTGELLGFFWKDYRPDLHRMEITRRFQVQLKRLKEGTKGGGGRFIPLNDFTISALEDYRANTPYTKPEDPLFHREDGSRVSASTLGKIHRRVADASGVPATVRFYDITRHKFASEVTKKLGLRAAQAMLGHSSQQTTERYAHDDPNHLLNEAVKLTVGAETGLGKVWEPGQDGAGFTSGNEKGKNTKS